MGIVVFVSANASYFYSLNFDWESKCRAA